MDADGCRRILSSSSFGRANSNLWKALANVVKNLCTDRIETQAIEALLSYKLTPLDKNSGIRPTSVGKVPRKIAGKVIVSGLKTEAINCTGSVQVWAGQEA